jgi:hypothetical protein
MNNLSISHVIEWISAVTKQSGYLLLSLPLLEMPMVSAKCQYLAVSIQLQKNIGLYIQYPMTNTERQSVMFNFYDIKSFLFKIHNFCCFFIIIFDDENEEQTALEHKIDQQIRKVVSESERKRKLGADTKFSKLKANMVKNKLQNDRKGRLSPFMNYVMNLRLNLLDQRDEYTLFQFHYKL